VAIVRELLVLRAEALRRALDWANQKETFPQTCDNYAMVAQPNGLRRVGSRNTTIDLLADSLPILGTLGRPVVNETGLSGYFDFVMEFV
jgi:uncharacterized protein (TIGR03435 family)